MTNKMKRIIFSFLIFIISMSVIIYFFNKVESNKMNRHLVIENSFLDCIGIHFCGKVKKTNKLYWGYGEVYFEMDSIFNFDQIKVTHCEDSHRLNFYFLRYDAEGGYLMTVNDIYIFESDDYFCFNSSERELEIFKSSGVEKIKFRLCRDC
jgi:hypothetical protein